MISLEMLIDAWAPVTLPGEIRYWEKKQPQRPMPARRGKEQIDSCRACGSRNNCPSYLNFLLWQIYPGRCRWEA
jgi:hypothetical protein